MYSAFPRPTHPDYRAVDGAYVSVFVAEPVQAAAEALAQAFIAQQDWDIEELDQVSAVTAAMYPPGHPSHDLFVQAQVDGMVATFHRWPVGASDEG